MISELDQLSQELNTRRRELDKRSGQMAALAAQKGVLISTIDDLKEQVRVYEKSSIVLNSIGLRRQADAQAQIESLVTQGLRTVFEDNLSFHMIQTTKGNRPDIEFVIRTTLDNGKVIETGLVDETGGGLVSVVGFLLRLVVLLLSTNQGSLLILDETFAHLSDQYVPAMGEFLAEMVKRTGIQIIMVTHHPEFANYADKVYHTKRTNGLTQVTEIIR